MNYIINFLILYLLCTLYYVFGEENDPEHDKDIDKTVNKDEEQSIYYYKNLVIEITGNKTDDIFNNTWVTINNLKSIIEFSNSSELHNIEGSFNETYRNYKKDVISILRNKDPKKENLFSNIEKESQEKLFDFLKESNNDGEISFKNTPINYIKGIEIDKWYEILDSANSFSLALMNKKSDGNDKYNSYLLNRKELLILTNNINKLLTVIFDSSLNSNCKQIAWNLVLDNYRDVTNINTISKKLIKKYDSSTTLLRSKNINILEEHNYIMGEYDLLNSNIKGLLDVLIKARSDKLRSLVFIEDIFKDIKSMESFSFDLNKNHDNWILSNKKMIKPLINWLEISINLVNKTILYISKSMIAFHIRNFIDLINTINESKNDIMKMNESFMKSLDFFDFGLKSIINNVVSIRNKDISIFSSVTQKFKDHLESLTSEYKRIIEKIIEYIEKNDIKENFNLFLEYSIPMINILWNNKIDNLLKFDSNLDDYFSRMKGIFQKISDYCNSDVFKRFFTLQDNLLKLRYYNEMLFPELILQFEIFQIELDNYQLNGSFDEMKLNLLLNRKFINNFIEKCYFRDEDINLRFNRQFKFITKMMNKSSMWESEKVILNDNEINLIDANYMIENKSKSFIKNFYLIRKSKQKENLLYKRENKDQIKFLKDQLMSVSNLIKKEIEDNKNKNIVSLVTSLNKKKEIIDNYIKELDSILNNIEEYENSTISYIIDKSQELLNKYGYYKENIFEENINKEKYLFTINNYKKELQKSNHIIQKSMKIIKKISNYNYDINILDDHVKMLKHYVSHLEGQIDLYCDRINKSNKTSRALSILKYMVRKKKPDTQCDNLIIHFSRAKNKLSNLIKESSEVINEFRSNYNACQEIDDISSQFKVMVSNYQETKKNMDLLIHSTLVTSFDEGTLLIKEGINKLSKDSKRISKQLDCYLEISITDFVSTYIKNIENEMVKLQNTIEKELKISLYED